MYFIGVDHHKQVSVMTVLDEDGEELKGGRVPNLRKHVERFLEGFRPFTAVLEAGRSSYVMADLLGELGGEVKIANALQVKAIAHARIKTDKRDSRTLAHLLRAGLIPSGFRHDAVGFDGGGDCGHPAIFQSGGASFLCRSDSLDLLLGRAVLSWAHHQTGECLVEMGGAGSGLSGHQERLRTPGFIQPAGPEERSERGQGGGGPAALDDYLSSAHREERLYSGDETIGCLGVPLTGSHEPRSQRGLGAEIECYGAHDGADRRVVQETEAAIKKDGEKKNVPKVLRFAIIEGE